jgi:hypothetical protein
VYVPGVVNNLAREVLLHSGAFVPVPVPMLPLSVLGATAPAAAGLANVTLKHWTLLGLVVAVKVLAGTVNVTIAPAAPCTWACVAETVNAAGVNEIPVTGFG